MQDWLEGLTGIHAAPANFRATVNYSALSKEEQQRFEEQAIGRHPLVIRHPVSGQRSPLRQSDVHHRYRRTERARKPDAAALPVHRGGAARFHLPASLGNGGDLVMWDELTTMRLGPERYFPPNSRAGQNLRRADQADRR